MNTPAVRPLSLINRILAVVVLVAVVAAVVRGAYGVAVVALVATAFVAVSIHRARRGRGSVSERINAFQPYDERDGELLARSYSLLGQAVFVAQSVMFLFAVLTGGDMNGEALRLLAICAIAIISTAVTVQRG